LETVNEVIHQPVRLKIMAALTALNPEDEGIDFVRLKGITGASDGNLGGHLDLLTRAGYVTITKAFVARRPRTTAKATTLGRVAFGEHLDFLRAIIVANESSTENGTDR
jgi:hypothetical protein